MDPASLILILEKTVSPDKDELGAAQNYLEEAAQRDLPLLLRLLSDVLKHGENSIVARMQAGLQLKNFLYSKDPVIKQQYHQRWVTLPEDTRNHVKKNCLDTLGTELRPSQAAQCIACIACAELPLKLWPEVIATLGNNVINPASTDIMKESTLEAIGYMCQDIVSIDPDILKPRANEILTAIVNGMKQEETSDHVRLAATTALLNSLEFTKANFDKERERNFIMQVVCEATQSQNTQVHVAALQCLVKIMSLYYQYMEPYMGPALFAISLEAMKSEIDEVSLQGIEFWSNVCDEEVDLAIEMSEAAETGSPPERTSKFYAKGALMFLIPILTAKLTKQEEYDDEDEWNPSKAAGVCLMLLASCCEDSIVEYVMPFIDLNIEDQNWRHRDAAVMALGSILEGPEPATLAPKVEGLMPFLIRSLQDPSVVVRDTTAWTIGRICEIIPDVVISQSVLVPLLQNLILGLDAEPRVAANVCWAFSSLAEAAYEAAEVLDEEAEPRTYCLTPAFETINNKLLLTTDREDGTQHNLRSAAYEALMELVKNSPTDCYPVVQNTTLVILERLQTLLRTESTGLSMEHAHYYDLQSLLCATLQSVLRKVNPQHAPQISDAIMTALLTMLQNSAGKSGGVQEDALLAVSTLVEVLGDNFINYMQAFKDFLMMGLKNYAEYSVCLAAVGLVGDICRALNIKVLIYCDDIMVVLLEILGLEEVHRSIKPQILSVFGDVALAIGPEFKKYLSVVISTLQQASNAHANINTSDPDMIDYLNELREGCLEAYTGIVQGLKGDGEEVSPDVNLIQDSVPHVLNFIETIAKDQYRSDGNISACCGLIGDLCAAFGVHILPLLEKEQIHNVLTLGRHSKTKKTKTLATWATKEMRKLKNAQS